MHLFFELSDGNYIAFFDLPHTVAETKFKLKDGMEEYHVAMELAGWDELKAMKTRLEEHGVPVFGPIDHQFCHSIYFFDPNGHRLELACNIGTPDQYAELRALAPVMLNEWAATKRAPRHAAWLHEDPAERGEG